MNKFHAFSDNILVRDKALSQTTRRSFLDNSILGTARADCCPGVLFPILAKMSRDDQSHFRKDVHNNQKHRNKLAEFG